MKFLKNKTVLSFLFPTIIFIIIYLLIGFRYCTDDDGTIARTVANGHLNPFSLIWTSYFSCWLHKTIPFVSAWGLFTLGSTYFAICKLTNIILLFKNKHIKKISLIALTIITIDILIQCNFTKTSFLTLCTGFLCIQEFLEQKEKKNIIWGIILIIIGYSIRPDTLYILIPFIGAYILIKAIQNKDKKTFFKELTIYFIISAILLSISVIDDMKLKSDLGDYIEFNVARSQFLDYNRERVRHDKTVDISKITTISENDLIVFNNYFFGDTDYFTTERIQKLNEEILELNDATKILPQKTLYNFGKLLLHPLGIILLYLLLISFKKKENFIYLLGTFLFTCLFTYMVKFPDRIIFCIIVSACFMLLYQLKNEENLINKKIFKNILTISIVIIMFFKFLIPVFIIYNDATTPINDYIEAHPNNNYLIGFSMVIERQCETNILSSKTDDLKENIITTSWLINHPFYENILKERNIQNINTDLVEKDNYYLVTYEDDKDCILMEKYLEEHYYEEVNYELIEEVNKYKIWKFQKEGVKK